MDVTLRISANFLQVVLTINCKAQCNDSAWVGQNGPDYKMAEKYVIAGKMLKTLNACKYP